MKKCRTFDEWFKDFVDHKQDGSVSFNFVTPEGYRLGRWVDNIRGGRIKLTEEQRRRLDEVGFRWTLKNSSRTFDEWFKDFVDYEQNGSVPQNCVTQEGYRLGEWVHSVRRGRCKVTEEQRRRLDEVGFKWRVRK